MKMFRNYNINVFGNDVNEEIFFVLYFTNTDALILFCQFY